MNNDNQKGQFSGKLGIEEALKRLNAKMVYAALEPVELVSCGGASLNLMGWVSRSTSDVDIICAAVVDTNGKVKLLPGIPLSPKFTELIAEVGHELGIKEEWLNFGSAPLAKALVSKDRTPFQAGDVRRSARTRNRDGAVSFRSPQCRRWSL